MSFVVTPCRKAPSMSNVATWRFSAAKIEPTACIETSWPQQVTCHSFLILKINETETSYYFTFVFDIIILGQGPHPFVMQLIHLFHKTKASVPYIASLLWELTSLWVRLDCCRADIPVSPVTPIQSQIIAELDLICYYFPAEHVVSSIIFCSIGFRVRTEFHFFIWPFRLVVLRSSGLG